MLNQLVTDAAKRLTDGGVDDVVTALLASRCSQEAAELARDHGWKPIVDAARESGNLFRRDYRYGIEIAQATGEDFYEVTTTLDLRRMLPREDAYVRFGRTAHAVGAELDEESLLGTELVPVTTEEWDTETVRASLSADVAVNQKHLKVAKPRSQGTDAYHLSVELPSKPYEGLQRVKVVSTYLMPRKVTYFPVKLADVYLYGETEITLRIDDQEVTELEAWVSLPDDLHRDPGGRGVTLEPSSLGSAKKMSVATTSQVLLWPGTMVMFVWRRKEPKRPAEAT